MYHYLGNERLQFFFFSPNVCAAFLVITALLTAGAFLFAVKNKWTWQRIWAGLFGLAFFLQLVMIAITYSRGGYVACFAALIAAAVFCQSRWGWVLPVLFLAVLLFTGSGASRVKSMGDVEDGSIRNRLLLWHYGTGVIADHWLVGTPEPGEYYTRYYQPLWLNEKYYSLINDYLTIAAKYGVLALFALLTVLFLLFQYGFRLYLTTRNELLLYALAAQAGYMISGSFTTCYRFPSILILLGILFLILAVFLIQGIVTKKFRRNRFDFWPAPVLAALCCVVLLVYGAAVNASLPYSWRSMPGEREAVILTPRHPPRGTFVVLASADDFRSAVRPLVERGYVAIALLMEKGFGELPLARKILPTLLEQGNAPYYLFGLGEERAIQAITLGNTAGLDGVVVVDPPVDWPFEELSPRERLKETQSPVHVLLSVEKEEEAKTFQELATPAELRITVLENGMQWEEILQRLDDQ